MTLYRFFFDQEQRIVDVFFDKVATYPKMLRKPVLQQNLRLSSTHSRFPVR